MSENGNGGEGAGQVSRRKLWIGAGVAAVAAAAILVFAVLPAEFGVDPLGAGEATGLSGLAPAPGMTELERGALRSGVLTLQDLEAPDAGMRQDRAEFVLEPFEWIEYKYTMIEGAPLVFSWSATDQVNYDMHAHPFDGGEAMTEGYGVGDTDAQAGLYVAAFTGIHGWYWQNRTLEPVTVTIHAAGFFSLTTVAGELGEYETPVEPLR